MHAHLVNIAAAVGASPTFTNPGGSSPVDSLVFKILLIVAAICAVPAGVTAFRMFGGADKGDVKKDMNRTASVFLASFVLTVAFGLGALVIYASKIFNHLVSA